MSRKYYFEIFEFESSTYIYNHKQNNENITKLKDLICSLANIIVTLYRAKGYEQYVQIF